MIDSILNLLGVGLELWLEKEKTKYMDRYLKLKKRYYEESKKDPIDNAVMDDIEFDLQLLVDSFTASVAKGSPSKDLQG